MHRKTRNNSTQVEAEAEPETEVRESLGAAGNTDEGGSGRRQRGVGTLGHAQRANFSSLTAIKKAKTDEAGNWLARNRQHRTAETVEWSKGGRGKRERGSDRPQLMQKQTQRPNKFAQCTQKAKRINDMEKDGRRRRRT